MKRAGTIAVGVLVCATVWLGAAPSIPAVVRVSSDGSFKQHLHFSPDSKRLLFTRLFKGKMGLWTVNVDGSGLAPLLAPEPNTPHFDGHFAPDGRSVIFVLDILHGTDGKQQINRCDADGRNSKMVLPNQALEESPRWSPDGKRFAWVSTRHGNQEIYSASADGSAITRLTNDSGFDNNPAWSPDGKRIAFTSSRFGNLEICTMNADGSSVRRLTHHPAMDCWPAWSPDGKRIAFTSNRDSNYEIYLMNADGSAVQNLTNHPAQDSFAAWSPDGKRIAFVSSRHGGQDVYVQEVR